MQEAPINLSQLESHLWESANILRGPVDAADFKTYIFPLLFFKRICDVWDEEYDEIVAETGDAELALFPESHRFQIPDDCHWNDVRAVATNVGNALQRAMREIEKANPDTLYGVFGDAQWTNKDRMAVVLPQGALFRKGAEGSIRQKLLEMDLVEAVIGLAPNLFYGTGLAACILVLRKKKPAQRRKKVMIADASRLFRRGRAQNYLEPAHALEIQGWFEKFEDVQDAVRVVGLDEIKAEDWTLNISRYVLPPLQEDIPPLPEASEDFKQALARCREAEGRLAKVMVEGGWLQ